MILDTSAVVAVICQEPGYEGLLRKIANAKTIAIGAPTMAETQLVLMMKLGQAYAFRAEQFLAQVQALVIPFDQKHISIFFHAYHDYGKGRHPAGLNMGDCFTYAIAKASGLPLLFVGNDFGKTDLIKA